MNDQEMTLEEALSQVFDRMAELRGLEREEAFQAMPHRDEEDCDWVDDWFAVQDVPLDEDEADFEPW